MSNSKTRRLFREKMHYEKLLSTLAQVKEDLDEDALPFPIDDLEVKKLHRAIEMLRLLSTSSIYALDDLIRDECEGG
jgi:hypothetical protein